MRDSEFLSSTTSSAVYIENNIYASMKPKALQEIDSNSNPLRENTDTERIVRKGDSTVYERYDPLLMPRDSTISSLDDDNYQRTSCFGRLSLLDPPVENVSYAPTNADAYQQIAAESPDSGSLDSIQVLPEGLAHDDTDDAFIVFDSVKNDNGQVNIDILKANIRTHFDEMCLELETELHCAASTALHRKVWFCYESHFYERTMAHLTKFYQLAYADVTDKFCESLLDLTVEDLELETSFVLHLLKDNHTKVFKLDRDPYTAQPNNDCDTQPPLLNNIESDSEMVEMFPIKQCDVVESRPSAYTPSILSHQLDELPPLENKPDISRTFNVEQDNTSKHMADVSSQQTGHTSELASAVVSPTSALDGPILRDSRASSHRDGSTSHASEET